MLPVKGKTGLNVVAAKPLIGKRVGVPLLTTKEPCTAGSTVISTIVGGLGFAGPINVAFKLKAPGDRYEFEI